jgi:hypothetical protein
MIDFSAGNWGNVASVAGLVFSILAFIFSKRASKAAREARDAALTRSMSEDLNWANKIAGEIATYVAIERGDLALLRTTDMIYQSSYFLARWDNRLSEESKNNLLAARAQLHMVHEVLTKGTMANLSTKTKLRLAHACGALVAELGILRRVPLWHVARAYRFFRNASIVAIFLRARSA